MEDVKSCFDGFDVDSTSNILKLLNDPSDLIRASAVSRSWRHFVIANGLCKKLWLRKVPGVAYIGYAFDESDGIIKLSDFASTSAVNWGTLEKEHKIFSSLLEPLSKPIVSPNNILTFPVGASSTHQDPSLSIINTLTQFGCSFWSGKGQTDPNAPEYLLYRLNASVSIVTEVHIRPHGASWEPRKPVYSPNSVRFRMGHPKSKDDVDMCPVDQPCLDKYVWTYTSPLFPMKQDNRRQEIKLPEPVVCIGGIVQIELLGRAEKDDTDGLFYIRLSCVKFKGRTLEPAFYAEMHQSGELQLNYHPQVVKPVRQTLPGENAVGARGPENETSELLDVLYEELCLEMAEGVLDEEDE